MTEQRDGSGILFRNQAKGGEKHPDYRGSITLNGVAFELAGWIREGRNGKFLSLSAQEPRQQAAPARRDQTDRAAIERTERLRRQVMF